MESSGLYSPPPAVPFNETDKAAELGTTAYLVITSNRVTDSQFTTSLWLNTVLGFGCFLLFCVLQRSFFTKHYRYRLHSPSVTVKPRPLPTTGFESYWKWLKVACTSTEGEIMRSCGLDAVVMIKSLSMGVKIFLPLAFIGCGVLLPIHYRFRSLENQDINRSQLMQLTIAALPRGSNLMWVHFVLIVLYNCWVMWVLFARYKEFVICRQHYLVKGDDPNYWIVAACKAEAEYQKKAVQKMLSQLRGEVNTSKKKAIPDDPAPMAIEPGPSTSPEPNVRDSVQSGMRSVLGRVNLGINLVGQSMNNLLKGKVTRRSSFESYKRYSDENNSTKQSSPVTSPIATAASSMGHQGWGLPRARSGATSRRSSDGMESGGDSSHGDGTGSQAAVAGGAGQSLSAGLLEAGTAATGSAGSHSSGSSRRWSGSSGDTSEGSLAAKSFEAGSSESSGKRSRVSRQGGKGRVATLPVSTGTPPTHQTINELQSIALQGALPVPLGGSYSDPPNQWPLMPKHMRTITEDSLEYRLDSSQGNNSRPSSRGGLFGNNTGHNRDSSAGTGDSPLSAYGRLQAAALSQALPAAGDSNGISHRHSHSHSHSGGSSNGVAAGANAITMSPLRKNSNLQPAVVENSSGGQPALAQDPAMRISMESLGRYSVSSRITHDSSPEDGGIFRSGTNSTHSSPDREVVSRGSSPAAPDSDLASYSAAATRDLSFGGMADLQQQRQTGQHSGRSSTSDVSPDEVRIGSFGDAADPAAVASQPPAPHHGYQTSVDFGALHLEDLSRSEELASPEGGFTSPQPRPSRANRNRGDSVGGRSSPFAESDGIASAIAAGGVGSLDEYRRLGVHRVQGVQSNPVLATGTGSELQGNERDNVIKQRVVRPGPEWQPPSGGGVPKKKKSSSSVHRHQAQQELQQQVSAAAAVAGAVPRSVKSAAALQHCTEEQDGLVVKPQPLQAPKQQDWSAVAAEGKAGSDASSAASSRVSSVTGMQNLQARATRQRVMPSHLATACARNSSDPSPGQSSILWTGNTWQLHAKSSNSCTSTSGPSCQYSPYGQQSFIPSKDVQAVAGAAIGAGQELIVPSAAAAAALMSPGPVAGVQPMQIVNNSYGEGTKRPAVVVHRWWKDLTLPELQDSDALEFWAHEEDPSYLAKPSVRYRKTVNCWSREEQRVIGVMAQHYAVLVTDVEQWPYPELQMAHEAANQNSTPQRAWRWLYNITNTLLQRLSGTPPEQLWNYPPDMPEVQENQHLLLQQQKEGVCMSDKHMFELPSPLPAMIDPMALAGGTSGGASVVVSRSSRGHNRGQLSSCATSSEHLVGVGGDVANSLACLSMHSHTTQHSYLPYDLSEGLMMEAQELALLEQKVLHRSEETHQKQQQLAKLEKVRDKIQRFNMQQHERQQVLSREQSSYHLNPPRRTASYLRLGGLASSGGFGQAGAMPGGWANQLASRTSSIRSIQQVRADHAVAGAATGAPEFTPKAQGASSVPSRVQMPTSGRGSLDAGMGAGPLTKDRLDSALAIMHTHREQQLRRRHGTLHQGWSYVESPWSLRQESSSASAIELGPIGLAPTAAADSAHTAPSHPDLEQVLPEPTTMAASAAAHVLQQKLSHPEPGAVADRQHHRAYDPAGDHSIEGQPPLVCRQSSPHSPSGTDEASTAAADPLADTMSAASGRVSIGPAFTGVQLAPQHHRRYVYRSASPSGGSPDGLEREAALLSSPSPSPSASSQTDDGDKALWSSTPTSPNPDSGLAAAPAAVAAVPRELRTLATAVAASNKLQSRSAGGAGAGGGMGLSESSESNASSHAARRPAVHFRPYPPDSPRAREQQAQQGFGSIVLVDGPAANQQSLRASIASRSITRLGGAGGSGGGIPPGPMPPPAAGRSRSARLSNNFADGLLHSSGSVSHPDHLCVIIPPPQQQMPTASRSTTPRASCGGFAGSGGGLGSGGGIAPLHLPAAPWGLPPDAALLTSSASTHAISAAGPADAMFHATPIRNRVSAPALHPSRWSVPGLQAERSVGNIAKILASPMSDKPDGGLIPAIGGLAGTGQAGSGSEAAQQAAHAKAAAAVGQEGSAAPVKRTGPELWRLVVKAHNEGRLLQLLQSDSYSVVTATFKRLFPEDFDKAIPVINHRKVDMLLMQWEETVAELERAQLEQLRTGVPPVKFTGRFGKLLSCFAALGCGSRGLSSKLCEACCDTRQVEVIPAIEDRMSELELQIDQARREAFASKFTPSWFVLFKSQKAASIAASTRIYAEDSTRFQVHPAPGPEEVNWQHLWLSYKERDCRTALMWPLMLLVVLFPITLVTSAASRLEYVFCPDTTAGVPAPAFVWEWYCTGKERGSALPSFIRALITGWLPSLLLNLWLTMVLPRLVYLIVQSEGSCYSLSALERRIGAVFYLWDVFNVFLQGTVGSTFFQQVRRIIQTPEQLPNILGAALPDSSNFFMQFIAMRALFLVWLRLCVPHGGVWQNWCRMCLCPATCCSKCNTERDKSLNYGPRTPRYGFEMGHVLMMYLIGLAFAIVSPMLLPFSVTWFMFAWVAWRHNLSYVYQRKYESGGLMWIFLFSRIVMCMVIGQLFTFCVLVVKGAYWQAFLTIAFMPALTARFYRYCQTRFARGIEYGVPLDMADRAYRTSVPAHIYIPPPLQDSSFGWYPEWNKIWDGWGMPAYAAV